MQLFELQNCFMVNITNSTFTGWTCIYFFWWYLNRSHTDMNSSTLPLCIIICLEFSKYSSFTRKKGLMVTVCQIIRHGVGWFINLIFYVYDTYGGAKGSIYAYKEPLKGPYKTALQLCILHLRTTCIHIRMKAKFSIGSIFVNANYMPPFYATSLYFGKVVWWPKSLF